MRGLGWLFVQWRENTDPIMILNDKTWLNDVPTGVLGGVNVMPGSIVSSLCNVHDYGPNPDLFAGNEMLALTTPGAFNLAVATEGARGTDFIGYFVESIDGLPGSVSRSVNQRASAFGGASFTRRRPQHLAVTFTVAVMASSEGGLNAGIANLAGMLMGPSGCSKGRFWMADDCGPFGGVGSIADGVSATWRMEGGSLLDAPRWVDDTSGPMNCVIRRCQFTLGAEDGHLYRYPYQLTQHDFVAPAAGGACYTWSEYFCNDSMPGISQSVTLAGLAGDGLRANESICAIYDVGGISETPPFLVQTVSGETSTFRILPLEANTILRIDGSRHRCDIVSDYGGYPTDDGSAYIDASYGGGPGWPELSYFDALLGSCSFKLQPWRICGTNDAAATMWLVVRAG